MTVTQSAVAQLFFSGGNSQQWNSSTANWSATTGGPYNQAWAAGTAVFEGTGANVTVSGTIANISGIRFNVAGYTLSGDSLPFPAHNSPITVNADAEISATITGAGGIRKEGPGTLTLSGSNTYAGATFLGEVSSAADAGVLSIADVAALGTGTGQPGRINFVGNGRLRYTGGGSQAITGRELISDLANSSMTIDVSNATGSLAITPTGGTRSRPFTKQGPGTLTMNGAFATGATITATGGTLVLGADNSNTGATTIAAGATLRVGAGGTAGALGSGAIGNAGTLVVNRSDALTMAQAISGAGSLVKEGTGTLTITGTNSYSGGTTVSAGTLAVGAGGTAGTLPGNAFVTGALTFNRSDAVTYAGVLSGTGTLRKEAANTLTLTGDSTIAAATVVAGTLSIGAGGGTGSFAGTIANSGTVTFDRTGSLTHAAAISGTGVVRKQGTGTVTFSADNTYQGGTNVSAGTLALSGAGAIAASSGLTLAVSGAGFDISAAGGNRTIGTLSGVAGSTITLGANSLTVGTATSSTFAGAISGTGGLVKVGAGTLTITGNNGYSGGTTISAGVIEFVSGGLGSSGTVSVSGGTLRWAAGNSQDVSNRLAPLDALASFDTNGNTVTLASALTGSAAGGLQKAGTGTLVLGATNTYAGRTFIDAGTLEIGDVGMLGAGTGNPGRINFRDNGTLRYTGGGSQAITGRDLFSDLANSSMTIDVSNVTGSLAITPSFSTLIRPFTKQGPGTLTMNGAFTGGATITATGGTLVLGADNSNTGATTIAAGATLRVGAGGTAGALGSGAIGNAGTLVVNRSDALTMAQAISGAGSLVKEGTGTLTITGTNSYAGGTTVSAGALALSGAGDIAASSGLTLAGSSASFNISAAGGNRTIGTLSGVAGSTITLGTNSLTASTANASTFAGGISGTGGLVKTGPGTLTLSGTNTYGGGTQIINGTLLVNGALDTGTVAVGAGTTLGGSGTIAGTIAGSGTVSVGTSPGILAAVSVDPAGGLGWDFEVTGSVPAWGTPTASVNDVLRLTDATSPFAASLTGANSVNFLFALPGADPISAGTYTVGFFTDRTTSFAANVASAAVDYWVLGEFGSPGDRRQFDVGAGGSAVWFTRLSAYDPALSASLSVVPVTADFGSGNVSGFSTSVAVVPEPGTLALAGLGLALTVAIARRRSA